MDERKIIVILSVLLIVLFGLIISTMSNALVLTGSVIANPYYSYTTAICDRDNFCEDYLVECRGNEIISFRGTGYAVQFPKDWKDLRDSKTKEVTC